MTTYPSQFYLLDKARQYVKDRTKKYVWGKAGDARLNQLKTEVEKNPSTFYVIIFDEAHHGATTNEDNSTPYSKLAFWNSQDFPNVFVLLVSATPWNLLSVKSKVPNREVSMEPRKDYQIIETGPDRKNRRKFDLHKIQWSDSYESDLRIGKACRIMVSSNE